MPTTFTASWDRTVQVVTGIIIVVCFGLAILLLWQGLGPQHREGATVPLVIGATIALGVVIASALLAPRRYEVGAGEVRICRPISCLRVPAQQIAEVHAVDGREVFRGAVRLGASGGLFGYFGLFYSAALKEFSAYATRRDSLVLLRRTQGLPVLLSPDDPAAFIAAVEALRPPVR